MGSSKEPQEYNSNLYPHIEPYSTGFLKVSDIHTLYWEQSGNPNGHPVVFLHGGPGAGTSASNRRFFDPEFYRIILLDQVFGGSWGSTLALAYSQLHSDKVTGIILRGIFLLRKKELDWFYEGGAAAIFPDAWEPFRDFIPEEERDNFILAYNKRLNSDDLDVQVYQHYISSSSFQIRPEFGCSFCKLSSLSSLHYLLTKNLLVTKDFVKIANFGLAREVHSKPPFTE
ncbi:hypothetical protein ZIOFF_050722 [Zingiber officinale]|uniref:Prolyl aminopeptidase n=1 Tax=Zingiber officinale TaxID=94328 RepID=A0A8J5KTT7_ZINOF|nr:hypothetical protein ZIOFF_050722 [Zingiber officinale]